MKTLFFEGPLLFKGLFSYSVQFLIAFFCVSALALPKHGGDAALLLLITQLIYWRFAQSEGVTFNKSEQVFIYLVWGFVVINLLGVLHQPVGLEFDSVRRQLNAFDGPSRWLILLPLLYLFSRIELNWRALATGLSAGIFLATWIAYDQVYLQGAGRASGASSHPIPFGEILVVADLFTLVLMIYAWNRGEKWLGLLLLVASLAAFYAAMLTGTRGALLAYGIMILVTMVQFYKQISGGVRQFFSKVVVIRLLGFVVIFLLVSQTQQYQHIKNKSMRDLERVGMGTLKGVGGGRGAMAMVALEGVNRYPLGVGTDNYRAIAKQITAENYFNWDAGLNKHVVQFNQAHNEWLNLLVENGIPGVLVFFLLFGTAAKIFWKGLGEQNQLIAAYAACGLMLLSSYFVFGMTQAVFSHNSTTIFFITFLYLFIGQMAYLRE